MTGRKKATQGDVRIGISGWTYPPWRGAFFPKGLAQRRELEFAASTFRTIEINGTFYSLQKPDSFAKWADEVPDGFVFSVKAPRYITHVLRARDAQGALTNFLSSGLLRLGPKLGPVLWQFPPNFHFDPQALASFLAMLPHDTEAAAAMARRHEPRMNGKAWTETDAARPMRHAIEIRHESFAVKAFVELLRRFDVALVCADTVEWPRLMDVTSDFVYCRLHGSEQLYASGYDAQAIEGWAKRIEAWRGGSMPDDAEPLAKAMPKRARDVFVYFDNDLKVRAPHDAQALEAVLAGKPPPD